MSVAAPILLRTGDEPKLSSLIRSSTVEAGLAQRARIVLLAAQGVSNTAIASMVGVSRPTVILWRNRYAQAGIAGLGDLERSGRPPVIDDLQVVVATLAAPPEHLGVTHWSARLLAKELGISFASVARIWRDNDLKPWKRETFKFSTDPELDAKVRDVVGLYLAPPEKAVVVCVDEKTQIQALDRTAPILPLRPGLPSKDFKHATLESRQRLMWWPLHTPRPWTRPRSESFSPVSGRISPSAARSRCAGRW